MKVNKYLAMLALGLGFCACSDDLDENAVGGSQDEKGTTYVAFTLDFKNAGSRAGTFEDGTEVGKDESNIKSAYLMLVDGNGNFVKVAQPEQTGGKIIMSVPAGKQTFYAVVNPDTVPLKNSTIDSYLQTLSEFNPFTKEKSEKYFVMASVEGSTQVVMDNVSQEEAKAGKNNFTIKVQRVAAKVTITCDNPTLESSLGILGAEVGGKLDSAKFYMRNKAAHATRMASTKYPNKFQEVTWGQQVTATDNGVDVYFKKDTDTGESGNTYYNNASPAYCLENIQAVNNYLQKNTTYVSLKTVFIPTKVLDVTSAEPKHKTNENKATFYVVNSGDLSGNYILFDDIKKEGTESEIDSEKIKTQGVSATQLNGPYVNGQCFFGPIWFGQETLNASKDAPVIRNYWYNLAITKIKLPGSPTEIVPDPDKPLEPETNVAITLNIMPWNFINKDLELQ